MADLGHLLDSGFALHSYLGGDSEKRTFMIKVII